MKPELAAKLQQAAEQVEAVAGQLDRTSTTCEHCAVPHWNNRDERQTAIELDAVAQKLRRFAKRSPVNTFIEEATK